MCGRKAKLFESLENQKEKEKEEKFRKENYERKRSKFSEGKFDPEEEEEEKPKVRLPSSYFAMHAYLRIRIIYTVRKFCDFQTFCI